MLTLEEYRLLKEEVEQLEKQATRAEGSLLQLRQQLKRNHNCKSEEEAEEIVKRFENQRRKDMKKLEQMEEAFKEKWKGRL